MARETGTKEKANPLGAGRKRRTQLEGKAFEDRIQAVNQKLGLDSNSPVSAETGAKTDSATVLDPASLLAPMSEEPNGGDADLDRTPAKLTLVLPGYIHDRMDSYCRAHGGRRWTKRYLVLKALRELGVEIDDADLVEDGRRARHVTKV